VQVTGSAPISYQWRKDGVAIAGATLAAYPIPSVALTHAGTYSVLVRNSLSNALSDAVILKVSVPPVVAPLITQQPLSKSVLSGASVTFYTAASGSAPLSYQWRKDGVSIPGATNPSFTLVSAGLSEAGSYSVVVSNAASFVISSNAVLAVAKPEVRAPLITTQPQAKNVSVGSVVALSVVASGTEPFTYQWKKDGVSVSGATNFTLEFSPVEIRHAGSYNVVVANQAGNAISDEVVLGVNPPTGPSISIQPQPQTVTRGASATFSVVATGTSPLAYQWKFNGNPIPGATNSSYVKASSQDNDAGKYLVVISNSWGEASAEVDLSVVPPVAPTITSQPQSQAVVEGDPFSFSVAVDGTAPFSYQWSSNGAVIAGATNSSLSRASAVKADAKAYSVLVTNAAGAINSSQANLSVTLPMAPSVLTSPSSQVALVGSAVSLSVVASGTSPLSYQWRKDGSVITGATQSTYSIGSAVLQSAGSYSVTISNRAGSVSSTAAALSVETAKAPLITLQPQTQSLAAGGAFTLMVSATGTAPLAYQWRKAGLNISGATNATLTVSSALVSDSGAYDVVVTNLVAKAISSLAQVTVRDQASTPPLITTQPRGQTVALGADATLFVEASGSSPIAYQWRKDGAVIPGATLSRFSILSAVSASRGDYSVTVSNPLGNVVSTVATVSVDSSRVSGPSISNPPISVTIAKGESARLKVGASGSGNLTYQWFQGVAGLSSSPISGATQATFTTPPLLSSTSFWVRVTDGLGRSIDSRAASVAVAAVAVVTASQQVVGPGYTAGGGVIITNTITYLGAPPTRIVWSTLLPEGWKYLGSGGSDGGVRPVYESSDLVEWTWVTVPPSPIKFSFMASVPVGASGDQVVGSIVTSQGTVSPYQTMAKPDPLVIRRVQIAP
jgi:hypothetical protein